MDLKQSEISLLIALDALLAHEGVTPAAQQLGISQPAMSAQLARLRSLFNDPLLSASGRRLVPTARALEIKRPLRTLLAELDLLVRESAQFDPATTDKTFRVIGTDYVHGVLAPALFDAVARQAPGARLALLPFDPSTVWRHLEEDGADLVLGTGLALPQARRRAGLTEDFVVIQRKGHPRGTGPLSLEAFCAAEHVLVSPEGGGFVGATDKVLAGLGRRRRVACSIPSFLLAPALIARSDLIALVPGRLARLYSGLVDSAAPPFPSPTFSVDLYWHPRRHHDPAHLWLRSVAGNEATRLRG